MISFQFFLKCKIRYTKNPMGNHNLISHKYNDAELSLKIENLHDSELLQISNMKF